MDRPTDVAISGLHDMYAVVSRPAFLLTFITISTAVGATEPPAVPDQRLTPGAIRDTDPAVVCAPGYARAHRVWHDKVSMLIKYGLPPSQAHDVEDDDRIPVCSRGDNADPRNHWPQSCTGWEGLRCVSGPAFEKDRLEAWCVARFATSIDCRWPPPSVCFLATGGSHIAKSSGERRDPERTQKIEDEQSAWS